MTNDKREKKKEHDHDYEQEEVHEKRKEDGKQSESLCDDDSNSSDSELSDGPLFPDPGVVDDGDDDVDAGSAAEERGKTAHKESMNGSVFLMPTAEAFELMGARM